MKNIISRTTGILQRDLADRWEVMVSNFFFDLLSAALLNLLLIATLMLNSVLSRYVFGEIDNGVESWTTQHAIMLLSVADAVFIVVRRVVSGWHELKLEAKAESQDHAEDEIEAKRKPIAIEVIVRSERRRPFVGKLGRAKPSA